jgi:ribA/ribD-fused uncharacterized protein
VTTPIRNFWGRYAFLSNFFVEPDGTHVEGEFQAAKAEHQTDAEWVLEAKTPKEAKQRGRSVVLRSDWEKVKIEVMLHFVRKKFRDHPSLASALKATGDAELIEGNHWGDTFWGVCKGQGQNHLGKILMQVRNELKVHRWKLSELKKLLKDDPDHWAVHCPECKVVSFAAHGDYVCIACRAGDNTQRRMNILAVEDPEDGDA